MKNLTPTFIQNVYGDFVKELLKRFIQDKIGTLQATNLGSNNIQDVYDLTAEISKAEVRTNELKDFQSYMKEQEVLISETILEMLLDEMLKRDPILFQAIWQRYESSLQTALQKLNK